MMQDLERSAVTSRTGARALEITPDGIRIETDQGLEIIPADTIVMATGARSFNPLETVLKKKQIPFELFRKPALLLYLDCRVTPKREGFPGLII